MVEAYSLREKRGGRGGAEDGFNTMQSLILLQDGGDAP